MTSIKIRIYQKAAKKPETTITIPLDVFRVASKLIPKKASTALEKEGIDLNEIVKLSKNKEVRGTLIEIENPDQRIVVSIE